MQLKIFGHREFLDESENLQQHMKTFWSIRLKIFRHREFLDESEKNKQHTEIFFDVFKKKKGLSKILITPFKFLYSIYLALVNVISIVFIS